MKVTIQIKRNPRTGKPITVISDIQHNPQVIKNLESKLKSLCGTGGFIEGKTITLNGSHLKKVQEILEKEGFTIKT